MFKYKMAFSKSQKKMITAAIILIVLLTLLYLITAQTEMRAGPDNPNDAAYIRRIESEISQYDCEINEGIWSSGACEYSPEVLIKKQQQKNECLAKKGKWGPVGLSRKDVCNLPTADGGKKCTDSEQCQGACLAEEPGATSGQCSSWTIMRGCYAFVNDGKAGGLLCAD